MGFKVRLVGHQRCVHFASLHLLPLQTDRVRGLGDDISGYASSLLRYPSRICGEHNGHRYRYFNHDISAVLNFRAGWKGHGSGAGRSAYLCCQRGTNAHVVQDPVEEEGDDEHQLEEGG